MIKRNDVDIALQSARNARDLLGAKGIVDDYASMRHMVDLETGRTYEGTHDIHTLILGEQLTGRRAIRSASAPREAAAPRPICGASPGYSSIPGLESKASPASARSPSSRSTTTIRG